MIDLKAVERMARSFVKEHSPEILTAMGVAGTVTTAILTGKATIKATRQITRYEDNYLDREMTKREIVADVWDLYIPAAVSGTFTIVCIVGSNRISSRRMAAAYSLMAVSEKLYEEYREQVKGEIGEKKEQSIRDTVAANRSLDAQAANPLVLGSGDVLCHELLTGRTFRSDMESLRRAQNDVNAIALRNDYCTIGEFYYILGLEQTSDAGHIGWRSSRQMELEFHPHLNADKQPCLAFDYNYKEVL